MDNMLWIILGLNGIFATLVFIAVKVGLIVKILWDSKEE